MPHPTEKQRTVSVGKFWVVFLGSLSLIPLSMIIGLFDTSTELLPVHDRIDQACFVIASLCGLFACGTGIYLTRNLTIIQRIVLPLVFMFETAIGIFLVGNHLSSIVEGWHDFPAGESHTRQAQLLISRAYQTHGKGASQYIQTMPVWSNLEITHEDFAFMQNHRRPDDEGKNPDEVASRGHFCADVTIEYTNKALRILHSGSQKLPQGTVVLCPAPSHLP